MNVHTFDFKIMNASHYRMPPPNPQGCGKIHCIRPESQIGGHAVRSPLWAQNSHGSHAMDGGLRLNPPVSEASSHCAGLMQSQ